MGKGNCIRKLTARTLLFPPRCAACGDLLHPCSSDTEAFCPLCRAAWETAVAEAFEAAAADAARGLVYLTYYRGGRTAGVPERLIYHLKHRGDPRVFAFIAARLRSRVLQAAEDLPTRSDTPSHGGAPLLFTYPPRRPSAVRRNGFDQSKRLAEALAMACGGDFVTLIRRTRHPAWTQKALDAAGRSENAKLSYQTVENAEALLRGRVAVICDDVSTTGATLNRCAHLLVDAGAALVILVAVAKNRSS